MEISAADRAISGGEDHRVVSCRIEFDGENRPDEFDRVQGNSVHSWDAAECVRVLRKIANYWFDS